jgi:hypothetical protein
MYGGVPTSMAVAVRGVSTLRSLAELIGNRVDRVVP